MVAAPTPEHMRIHAVPERSVADSFLEPHFKPQDLAKLWGYSTRTIQDWFREEPGVHKRKATKKSSLRIPESVAKSVYERHRVDGRRSLHNTCNEPLQPGLTVNNPSGVILLRDGYRAVRQKPRNILKLRTTEQHSNRKRVA